MKKLLAKFAATPTPANAKRVMAYADKHPMWSVGATQANMQTFYYARKVAGKAMAGY